jgi:hypothetical protein
VWRAFTLILPTHTRKDARQGESLQNEDPPARPKTESKQRKMARAYAWRNFAAFCCAIEAISPAP